MNQKGDQSTAQEVENTDREIWREREGDYYANSIHVTKEGSIGINVGGSVYVKPLAEWHRLAWLVDPSRNQRQLEGE